MGKTSIRKFYMGENFSTSYLPTLGADFAVKKINLPEGIVELQIWDIGGQTAFQRFVPRFLQNSSSSIFVFDLTEKTSLYNLTKWVELFKESNSDMFTKIPLIFLGNKNDLRNQAVSDEEVKSKIDQLTDAFGFDRKNSLYSRTSALTGENIESVFNNIGRMLDMKN